MGHTIKTPASLKRFDHLIDEVEDDRGDENGYWIYLKYGWINPLHEIHMVHEDTLKRCAEVLAEVVKCECAECIENVPAQLVKDGKRDAAVELKKAEVAKIVTWAAGQKNSSIAARRALSLAQYIGATTGTINELIGILSKYMDNQIAEDKPINPAVVITACRAIQATLLPGVK
jgi:hypothetical protein